MRSSVSEDNTSIRELLASHPLFVEFPPNYLDILADCATNVHFHAGDTIFREGDEADRFYLLSEGEVALEAFSLELGHLPIQTLQGGDVFGWSWLVPPYRWRFDAEARTEAKALALDGKRLRTRCEEDPVFGYELLKRVVVLMEQRLQATRAQLVEKSSSRH